MLPTMRSLGRTARGVPLHGESSIPSLLVLDDYLRISAKHFGHLQPPKLQVELSDTYLPQRTAEERSNLIEKLYPYDIISTMRERTPFSGELLHQLPNLKLLLCTGTQFETFDLETAKKLGITVASALGRGRSDGTQHKQDIRKGGSHPATHHTWAMILALARNIAADDASIKAGGWQSDMAIGLSGKTLGVVGLGRLGAAVARIGSLAFGMKIKCWSSSLDQAKADEMAVKLGLPIEDEDGDKTFQAVSKEELFATADVVTLHYVLSDRSRGLIGAKELAAMKQSALLINTSRAALIDETALLEAANECSIRGVALDVFESEPLPADSPWRSQDWGKGKNSRVLVTPHMGYVEEGIMNSWYAEQAENVERWLDGKDVLHQLV
ncbi:D-3-phosphoglycerate dehydrogenase [Fusarium oxysporum f. sp. cubense race 1]|uniref:D-3-phosphoglycerate dehydrogenase n=1 Tax=Fusarium oxysporum f. sp. cubense (strain race 1) TaxID=1229664 RepID=N4UXM3_FUSC1|nr:D-3-phosphoglycerate dehydrogenase [Fusarium oxysporum f. sp. cubense race 1]